MKHHNHIGFIGFTIISEDEDPESLSADVIRSALLQRIIDIDANNFSHPNKNQDWQSAVDFGETYIEDES